MQDNHRDSKVHVLAVDGPSGAGKGTSARLVAKMLGYHYVDSGAVYRVIACMTLDRRIPDHDEAGFAATARELRGKIRMENGHVYMFSNDVTRVIRTPSVNARVPLVAKVEAVRLAVRETQVKMRQAPGLVADGRDMWEVFLTPYMFFLTAPLEVRARRRFAELNKSGAKIGYSSVLEEMRARDHLDTSRTISPLRPHAEAEIIDTSAPGRDALAVATIIYRSYRRRTLR